MSEDAKNIIGLYRRHAEAWARRRGQRVIEQKWVDRFLEIVGDGGGVLDLGCGTGDPIARYMLAKGHAVTGVDASPELIEIARTNLPGASWRVSDMRDLSLGQKFQGLLAWNSTFHLTPEDQRKMFLVFQRHASRGAALMFTCGPSLGVEMGEFEGEPLYHASLDQDAYREALDQIGFDVVDNVVEDPECGGQSLWLARFR